MSTYKNLSLLIAFCLVGLLFSSPKLYACGDGMFRAMTFLKYPEAKIVVEAIQRAREVRLPRVALSTNPEVHRRSLIRTRLIAEELQNRYAASVAQEKAPLAIRIFFVEEAFVSTLETGRSPNHQFGSNKIDLFTAASVLEAIMVGRLSWDDAVKLDLIVFRAQKDRQVEITDRLQTILVPTEDKRNARLE